MLAFYVKVLGLNLAATNFALLMIDLVTGSVNARDFFFLNAIHFLVVTLVSIFLDLFASGVSCSPGTAARQSGKE